MTKPWERDSKEAVFLRSALTTDGAFASTGEFLRWFKERNQANRFVISQIPFAESDHWFFEDNPYRLRHSSGRFFTIQGIRVRTDFGPVREWDQPIINQPEIGILGIITKRFNNTAHFLMQAKMEPGNVNTLQLSPTVQATKSNYTRIHQGKQPTYLEYFTDRSKGRILVDQLQSEQGSRFLYKRNRNMIVEVDGDIPEHEDFCWLTLGQIKELLLLDNLVNMDARTVLSCIPFTDPEWNWPPMENSGQTALFHSMVSGFRNDLFLSMLERRRVLHPLDDIISWFTEFKTRHEVHVETISLRDTRGWNITDDEIRHETGRFFSVAIFSVEAGNREVTRWTQPLLKHFGHGVVGFLAQRKNGVLHFLVRASLEPGNRDTFEMGPTIACSGGLESNGNGKPKPLFLEQFLNAPAGQIRYSAVQSEEGGRFHHFQNRYMIVELPEQERIGHPEHFLWMTLGQILDFIRYGYFNIEARNLVSCLSLLPDSSPE